MRCPENSLQQIYKSLHHHSSQGEGVDEKNGEDAMAIFVDSISKSATKTFMVALLCVIGMCFAFRARAQSPALVDNSGPIDEIVVTAQKRTSTIQTTPISITAVTGEDLLARGVASLAALAKGSPAVALKSQGPSQAV